jgi:integrase
MLWTSRTSCDAPGASRTTSSAQTSRSQACRRQRLKIIQVNVGHETDSSTAIYTHVSDDFMNTALRRALAPALDVGPGHKKEDR